MVVVVVMNVVNYYYCARSTEGNHPQKSGQNTAGPKVMYTLKKTQQRTFVSFEAAEDPTIMDGVSSGFRRCENVYLFHTYWLMFVPVSTFF